MQTKTSYRALKWTLFMGLAASLASACVVTSGDGDDDDVTIDGGDGNTGNTGNKSGSGGKGGSSTGGKGGSGGSATAGTTSMAGAGGDGDDYEPGLCFSDDPVPTEVPSCDPKAGDGNVATDCLACLKARCCDAWQTCYGQNPASACGWGAKFEDNGQFDCIVACFEENNDGVAEEDDILADCDGMCLNQCVNEDFTNTETQALVACALNGADDEVEGDDCHDQCFPPPM
jgi:hypothetical protein